MKANQWVGYARCYQEQGINIKTGLMFYHNLLLHDSFDLSREEFYQLQLLE